MHCCAIFSCEAFKRDTLLYFYYRSSQRTHSTRALQVATPPLPLGSTAASAGVSTGIYCQLVFPSLLFSLHLL